MGCNHEFPEAEEIKAGVRADFPKRLRNLRETIGLSQESFAKALGVSRAAIGYYENGERMPDISFLAALYDLTGCSMEYLIGYSDTMATYKYTDYALEYDLSDHNMSILNDLLRTHSFRKLLSAPRFSLFFKELDALAWNFGRDIKTKAIIEYLCVSSLGCLVGQSFIDSPRKWDDEEQAYEEDETDEIFKAVNHIKEHLDKMSPPRKENENQTQEGLTEDPFWTFRTKMLKLSNLKDEKNAQT